MALGSNNFRFWILVIQLVGAGSPKFPLIMNDMCKPAPTYYPDNK
ncbi:hypothetical protein NSP_53070 [Nodularia spumigena CCY9414]|nr:hypothetical protein NSP_53070 [Nodularia spumigena CCY9414]